MPLRDVAERKVHAVAGRHFIFVSPGQGEGVRLHLASHGVQAVVRRVPGVLIDRLELEGEVDVEAVEAILDDWER